MKIPDSKTAAEEFELISSEKNIVELLGQLSKEQLIDFIAEYAENDDRFFNAIHVRFRKPVFQDELNKIKSKIDQELDGVSDYRTHDSWGNVHFNVGDILEEIDQRANQGHIRLAFAEIELLYRRLLENFEYQGECEISDEAEFCLKMMSEIADKAVLSEDKEHIFKTCMELTAFETGKDYGADYEDKLLAIAARFVTSENLEELENVLAPFESGWREEKFKLIRLEIISNMQGESAADSFIAPNLRFPKIREIAFDKAVSRKDYAKGAQLCVDALSMYEHKYGISPWLYKLYSVYEMAGNTAEITRTAEVILLGGDSKYYDILKSLLEKQGVWQDLYLELLRKCGLNLYYARYMEILAKEKEYELLLKQLKKHADQIYLYGKLLTAKYQTDVCAIFTAQISKEAEKAYGRDAYHDVCSHILCFTKAGYQVESIQMINDFKLKYKRKPAFVDELDMAIEQMKADVGNE